jgi:hypothetical protein
MQGLDNRELGILAEFAVALLEAKERRARPVEPFNWPRWFAEMNGLDLDNPPFADGRHLRRAAQQHEGDNRHHEPAAAERSTTQGEE